jgi:hypothetical protein
VPEDVDFDFGPDPARPGLTDQLDTVPSHRTTILWTTLAVLAVIVLSAGVVVRLEHRPAHRAAAPTNTVTRTAPIPALQQQLADIADDPAPLTDNDRTPASFLNCPTPPGGRSPLTVQLAVVHVAFPGFGPAEGSQALDADQRLCATTIRAKDTQGDVLVALITAPPNPAMPESDVASSNAGPGFQLFLGTDYVSDSGFRVQIGLFVVRTGTFLTQQVEALATDVQLTW